MSDQENIQRINNHTVQGHAIRTVRNEEEWYFSIVDVIYVLTESSDPQAYWNKLKQRLKEEGAEDLLINIRTQKLKSADGKLHPTDVANTEQLLRIIQSIPSKKAESLKFRLAKIGYEHIKESMNPELVAKRLMSTYKQNGYIQEWLEQAIPPLQQSQPAPQQQQSQAIPSHLEQSPQQKQALNQTTTQLNRAVTLNHVVIQMIEESATAVDSPAEIASLEP